MQGQPTRSGHGSSKVGSLPARRGSPYPLVLAAAHQPADDEAERDTAGENGNRLFLHFLLAPEKLGLAFFLSPIGTQGLATLRADFPGFFIGASVFALVGAWTAQARPLLVPILMLSLALFGRFVSIAIDGMAPTAVQPMVVEAVMVTLLFLGWRSFDKGRP